jgi:Ca2+-binding EF-hand superfamily protein
MSSRNKRAFSSQPLRTRRDYGEKSATSFVQFDSDSDGRVSPKDWEEGFSLVDTDGSGFISDQEWENNNFKKLDSNNDGVVSLQDWLDGFDELDADKDGYLNQEDFYTREAFDRRAEEGWADSSVQTNSGYNSGLKRVGPGNSEKEIMAEEFDEFDEIDEMVRNARVLGKKGPNGDKRAPKDVKDSYENLKSKMKGKSLEDWEKYEGAMTPKGLNQARIEQNLQKKKANHHSGGSYMSLKNLRQMEMYIDTIRSQVHQGEDLDDWVEDKISHAHAILSDLFGFFGFGDGFHQHTEEGTLDYDGNRIAEEMANTFGDEGFDDEEFED